MLVEDFERILTAFFSQYFNPSPSHNVNMQGGCLGCSAALLVTECEHHGDAFTSCCTKDSTMLVRDVSVTAKEFSYYIFHVNFSKLSSQTMVSLTH